MKYHTGLRGIYSASIWGFWGRVANSENWQEMSIYRCELASYYKQVIRSLTTHSEPLLFSTMKSIFVSLLAVASTASAHYTFPELIVGSQKTGLWSYVRKAANFQSNGKSPALQFPHQIVLKSNTPEAP